MREFYGPVTSRKSIAHIANVASAVLAVINLPPKRRGLVLAAVGLSKGCVEPFKCSLLAWGKRLYPFDEALSGKEHERREANIEDQTRRELKKLINWESENKITLIEYTEGGRIAGENIVSKICVAPLMNLIQETMAEYPKRSDSGDRLVQAARVVVQRNLGKLALLTPKSRQVATPPSAKRWLNSAITAATKYAEETSDGYSEIITELSKRRAAERNSAKAQTAQIPGKSPLPINGLQGNGGDSRVVKTNGARLVENQIDTLSIESQGGGYSALPDSFP